MKKIYEKPSMTVVRLQQMGLICTSGGDPVRGVQTGGFDDPEDDFLWGGGGNNGAR